MKILPASLLITVAFGGGWFAGKGRSTPSISRGGENTSTTAPVSDRVIASLSSVRDGAPLAPAPPFGESNPLSAPIVEKQLRAAPYADLKRIFLERQDAEWERQQARYAVPKEMPDDELDRRTDRLFERFQRYGARPSYYGSRGEARFRGGKFLRYLILVKYYASGAGISEASEAPNGSDLCFASTVYLRIGEKYSVDAASGCLPWVAVRQEYPFALHMNYNAKRMVPYFDALSVALPGFADREIDSEWHDSATNRWTSIGPIHFDPISKDEFRARTQEANSEADGN